MAVMNKVFTDTIEEINQRKLHKFADELWLLFSVNLLSIARKKDVVIRDRLHRTYVCKFGNDFKIKFVVLRISDSVVRKIGVKQALINALEINRK